MFGSCIKIDDWAEGYYQNNIPANGGNLYQVSPTKFMLAAPLSKHIGYMAGVDLSRNPLSLDVSFVNPLAANTIVKTFVEFDATLVLSKANGVLLLS